MDQLVTTLAMLDSLAIPLETRSLAPLGTCAKPELLPPDPSGQSKTDSCVSPDNSVELDLPRQHYAVLDSSALNTKPSVWSDSAGLVINALVQVLNCLQKPLTFVILVTTALSEQSLRFNALSELTVLPLELSKNQIANHALPVPSVTLSAVLLLVQAIVELGTTAPEELPTALSLLALEDTSAPLDKAIRPTVKLELISLTPGNLSAYLALLVNTVTD